MLPLEAIELDAFRRQHTTGSPGRWPAGPRGGRLRPADGEQHPAAPVAAPLVIAPTGYAESFVDRWLRSAGATDSGALRAVAPGVNLPKVTTAKTATVEKTVAVRSAPMGGAGPARLAGKRAAAREWPQR
ncbi:hypothetical protein ACWC9T_41375 [Kitasatospora sp. NPDC001159]